jgi:hypothetical protein
LILTDRGDGAESALSRRPTEFLVAHDGIGGRSADASVYTLRTSGAEPRGFRQAHDARERSSRRLRPRSVGHDVARREMRVALGVRPPRSLYENLLVDVIHTTDAEETAWILAQRIETSC